jgi:hypothetical protein
MVPCAGVGDERADALGRGGVIIVHFGGIERVSTKKRVGDGVFLFAGGFDVRFEQRCIEQIDDAETTAGHLVLVGGADALAGGADLLASGRGFGGQLDHPVIGQDDVRTAGDEETAVDVEAGFAHAVNLVQEINGIEDDAVADDAYAIGANDAAGNELQDELVLANDDGVPGVMAAGVTRHGGEPLAKHVDNLSLTLIAPLGTQHYSRLCSHSLP